MSDPKLLTAMEEIKAVLAKHDIGGMVTLALPGHMEHLMSIAPSWSCASLEELPEGTRVRVRCKRADYPDKATQYKALTSTAGMFLGFMDVMKKRTADIESLMITLSQNGVSVEHMSREV